jgi:hypothetical protein
MVALFTSKFIFQKFYVLPTKFIYVFYLDLKTDIDYTNLQIKNFFLR